MGDIEYIEEYGEYGIVNYRPLNPTGRWKIESGPYYKNKLFIEHKGFVFKSWISEAAITMKPKQEIAIFECGK